jgi:hypothetical protein
VCLYITNFRCNVDGCRALTFLLNVACVPNVAEWANKKPNADVIIESWILLSVAFNLIATGLIGWRLLGSRSARAALRASGLASRVGAVAILLAESAVLYTIAGILYGGLYLANSPALAVFRALYQSLAVGLIHRGLLDPRLTRCSHSSSILQSSSCASYSAPQLQNVRQRARQVRKHRPATQRSCLEQCDPCQDSFPGTLAKWKGMHIPSCKRRDHGLSSRYTLLLIPCNKNPTSYISTELEN